MPAGAAVKEEQIENKLASIQADWAGINLVFAEYKTRGPVILKGSDTAELIEKLEDSQMTLGSMATNRYSAPFREEVQGWIVKLSTVSEIVEQWLMVQNMVRGATAAALRAPTRIVCPPLFPHLPLASH
jgi:dynein heavy chain